jgi:hypothetical protein
MPDIDSTLVGFGIEKLFEYSEIDKTTYLDWCHGEVISINGDKMKYATIRWDEDCLRDPGIAQQQEKSYYKPSGIQHKPRQELGGNT